MIEPIALEQQEAQPEFRSKLELSSYVPINYILWMAFEIYETLEQLCRLVIDDRAVVWENLWADGLTEMKTDLGPFLGGL